MSRRLVFVTGTRADFGKILPLAEAVRDEGYQTAFFVTGMHMLERYGLTKIEVHRVQGVEVVEFLNQKPGDGQDTIIAKTLLGFSDFLAEHRPDLVVVHGDRAEALACALSCAVNYVRCAHIEGGEVSGTIDELFRHCNTKLATYHFVSSNEARDRVHRLGESKGSTFVIGSPELDVHSRHSGVSIDEVRERYGIPTSDYGVVLFHPVTSEADSMGAQAQALFGALAETGKEYVTIFPNNDPGSEAIHDVVRQLPPDSFRTIPSMRFHYFSELLKNAAVVIGNSSAGVREAPYLGVPSLDIGTRQSNRTSSASVSSCDADDRTAILEFVEKEWRRRYSPCTSFGTGGAADRFVNVLRDETFWSLPLQKTFSDTA